MTIKEFCTELGARLEIKISFPRGRMEEMGGTHTCILDPEYCSVIVGNTRYTCWPQGTGWSEKEAIDDMVLTLAKHNGKDYPQATVRCRSIYDDKVREMRIPINLTA